MEDINIWGSSRVRTRSTYHLSVVGVPVVSDFSIYILARPLTDQKCIQIRDCYTGVRGRTLLTSHEVLYDLLWTKIRAQHFYTEYVAVKEL